MFCTKVLPLGINMPSLEILLSFETSQILFIIPFIMWCEFCWISKTALSLSFEFQSHIWKQKKLLSAISGEPGGRWWWPFCFLLWTIIQDRQDSSVSMCIIMLNQPIYISQDSLLKTPCKTCTILPIVSFTYEGWICDAQPHHSQVRWSICSSMAPQYFSSSMELSAHFYCRWSILSKG
jgi:hypothetical protein